MGDACSRCYGSGRVWYTTPEGQRIQIICKTCRGSGGRMSAPAK